MRVLLVEDHRALREMMAAHLRGGGFVTDAVARGDEALAAASTSAYDAIILDLGLPDLDGITVLRALRSGPAADVPVLVLTARDAIDDRVQGLDAGADDYLLKPFDLNEFDARLRSVLRRPGLRRTPVLDLGILTFDTEAREARIRGVLLDLSRRELSLLEELARGVGRTVVRDTLEDRLYGLSDVVSGNALEAAVSRLRRHLLRAGGDDIAVETIRGIGYRLVVRTPAVPLA
ncbi:response regulator transcription factor [Lichenicoccus sp.]|uniref:response regulator transcription factor n=1 Tax=Lichenicoccus sp. TaxID=2781899 RepID=UPI003D10B4BB